MRRWPRPTSSAHSPSRAVTDSLLSDLRRGRLRPAAWARFLTDASGHSFRDAAERPHAVLQVTALHAGFAALRVVRGRAGLAWIGCSWGLAVIHLGLLEDRRGVGVADLLTLTRANLPAVAPQAKAAVAVAAAVTDVLDGPLARWSGTTTPFGRDADSLADAAFWTWFATRHEPSPLIRMLLWAAWGVPVLMVTGRSVARGRMVEPPRSRWLRPAATLQAVLLVRAVRRRVPPRAT
jgi:hypothetical protein